MKLNKKTSSKKVEKSETTVFISISPDELKNIIVEKVKTEMGYDVKTENILFKKGWKYVGDEWGMNRSILVSFDGVEVLIDREVE